MLWAVLGRLAVPAVSDTVAKVDGATLRADIGRNPAWRVTFVADHLTRIERIIDSDQIGQQRTGRLVPVAATF